MSKVLYVGVDVAKRSLAVAVWGASGGTTLEAVANERSALRYWPGRWRRPGEVSRPNKCS